jgi:hypothetical protein
LKTDKMRSSNQVYEAKDHTGHEKSQFDRHLTGAVTARQASINSQLETNAFKLCHGRTAAMASRERIEPRDASDVDGQTERLNGAFGKSDMEGKAAMGSGERAGKRTSFKWAGAHESVPATSEFQWH